MIVSPTEHHPAIRALGRTSPLPERWGCDVMARVRDVGWVGVQRKRWDDLLASVEDGRLALEARQWRNARVLLALEGRVPVTDDGAILRGGWGQRWTLEALWAVLWGVTNLSGSPVTATDDAEGTARAARAWVAWWRKGWHRTLETRPGPGRTPWGGDPGDKEWATWVMQGFPGVGPEIARRIVDRFGGAPLKLSVPREELLAIEGIGEGRVGRIERLFGEGS